MLRSIAILMFAVTVTADDTAQKNPESRPAATTRPAASQPAPRRSTLRKPGETNVLDELLNEREETRPILPQPGAKHARGTELGADGLPLVPEGTTIQQRPARLVREAGRSKLVFSMASEPQASRTMELTPNQLREAMEVEFESGVTEFVVSGEVKLYRGGNYLELIVLQRRVANGNLSP